MSEEFSIIIPVFNRAGIVTRTLDSVKAQSYRPLHLVIVDNDSSDDSFGVVSRWSEANEAPGFRITILRQTIPGAPAARNLGLEAVTSDKLLFFDSDDTMRPSLAADVMRAFSDNPEADIVTWKCLLHPLHGNPRILHHLSSPRWDLHIYHAALRTQGYAMRHNVLSEAGPWDAEMKVWNDWELGVRILLTTPEVVFLDKILVDIYSQPQSITGTGFAAKAGEWEKSLNRADQHITAAAGKQTQTPKFSPRRLHRMIAYRRIILAAHYSREGHPDIARDLLNETLGDNRKILTPLIRTLFRLCYHYTRLGGRGAAIIADRIL